MKSLGIIHLEDILGTAETLRSGHFRCNNQKDVNVGYPLKSIRV